MNVKYPNSRSTRVGVIMRRTPGVTRWAKWYWRAQSILPGAPDADWKLIGSEGDFADFHAATCDLWLYVSDTEAYAHELGAQEPSVYVVLRPGADTVSGLEVAVVTVSPYEAQDYADSGEELVEKVPMPPQILAWVVDFVKAHHVEEPFVKRRRDKRKEGRRQSGIGDARITQATDVYRAPTAQRHEAAE